MNKVAVALIAALLVSSAPALATAPVLGYTVDEAVACDAKDLGDKSKALIRKWWILNKKRVEGTLTEEERIEGYVIAKSGVCGFLLPDTPVTVLLMDGVVYLVGFVDGTTMVVLSDGISEKPTDGSFKKYQED